MLATGTAVSKRLLRHQLPRYSLPTTANHPALPSSSANSCHHRHPRCRCFSSTMNHTTKQRTGRCSCGQVQYTLTGDPLIVHACHCTDCQTLTGSAFVLNAWTEATNVQVKGELKQAPLPSGSGNTQTLHYCPHCSTTVFSNYTRPETVFLRVGTLDDPSSCPPDVHIFTRARLKWLNVDTDAQQFEAYYNPKELWSKSSLERWKALKEQRRSKL